MATSAVDELRKDHDILMRDMATLSDTIRALGEDSEATQAALDGRLRGQVSYLAAGMGLHCRREEEALFPDAQRMVSEGAQGADVMGRFFGEEAEDDLCAHTTLRERMQEMVRTLAEIEGTGRLDEGALTRLRALFSLIKGLVERHAAKEDSLIFPMIERSLTAEQRDAVLDRLAAVQPQQGTDDPRVRTDGPLTVDAARTEES
jgi:hemerythrin-like domain-containing protein